MKQVLQNLKSGVTEVTDVPSPIVRPKHVLIQTRQSLISAGTERMMVEFGKASLLAKARSQPDKVKQVLDKIKTDGLLPTMEAVFSKLDEPMPLGRLARQARSCCFGSSEQGISIHRVMNRSGVRIFPRCRAQ